MRRGGAPAVVTASLLAAPLRLTAQTTGTWASATSGFWNDASKWSGGVVPNGSGTDALIDASGAGYVVTTSPERITLHHLACNSPSAILRLATFSTLAVSNGIDLNAGTLQLAQGTLSAAISGPGSIVADDFATFFSFDAVNCSSNVRLGEGVTMHVYNGLTLANSTVSTANSLNTDYIVFHGTQTLSGTGTILFNGSGLDRGNLSAFGGTLTLGPAVTIRTGTASGIVGGGTGASIINQGIVSAGAATTLTINSDSFRNFGHLRATDGGTLLISANNFSNSGMIEALNYGNVVLSGRRNTSDLGSISAGGGAFIFSGTLNNAASTLHVDGNTGTFHLAQRGWIDGGSIATSGAGVFEANGGSFAGGVHFSGNLNVSGDTLNVYNGLTLDGATVRIGGGTDSFGNSTSLSFLGSQSLDGNGEIRFEDGNQVPAVRPFAGTLTVGPGITIRTDVRDGTVGANGYAVVNYGRILGINHFGGINLAGTFTNLGTLEVKRSVITVLSPSLLTNLSGSTLTGGTWNIGATGTIWMGSATITVNAADVHFDAPDSSFPAFNTLATNSGRLSFANRAFVTVGDLNNSSDGSITLFGGSALVVNGRLTNSGTIDLASAMMIDYGNDGLPDPYAQTAQMVAQARHGGDWLGPGGINSSPARLDSNHATTVAAVRGSEFRSIFGNTATFAGRAVDETSLLLKYTWYGDTDLNGRVNFDDYVRIDNGFNSHLTGWFNGDFDYSGAVNFDDYVLIDLAFNTQSGTLGRALAYVDGSDRSLHGMSEPALERVVQHFGQFGDDYASHVLAAVPEPSTLTLAVVPALAGMLRVRPGRRRRAVLGATFHGGATVATATSSAPPTPALHRPSACSTARTCR